MVVSSIVPTTESGTVSEPVTELLRVDQLEVTYNRVAVAIQGVSVGIPEAGIGVILGSNGAGKTTSLRAITGFMPAETAAITDGNVFFRGKSIKGMLPHQTVALGIALIPERDKIFSTLTVAEHLRMIATPRHADRAAIMSEIMELFPVLAARQQQVAGYLSGGEQQMLAIAQALLLSPRLLLVDEISLGLSPLLVSKTMEILDTINKTYGTSILLVEQNAFAALAIADYAYVMENGQVVFAGTPDELMQHADIREFYLGLGADSGVKSFADVKQYKRKRRWWG